MTGQSASGGLLLTLLVLVALVGTALAVSWSVHQSRKLTSESQQLQTRQDRLHTEWSQLQLEQSTWGGYARVERLAREEMNMRLPAAAERQVVRP